MPGDVPGMGGMNTPDPDYGENVSVAGTLSNKGDFDRRKKKRYVKILMTILIILWQLIY